MGDSGGGLTAVMRDDLSETIDLRNAASAAVTALSSLSKERTLIVAHKDGRIEAIRLPTEFATSTPVLFSTQFTMLPTLMSPASCTLIEGHTPMILVTTRPDCMFVWQVEASHTEPTCVQASPHAVSYGAELCGNARCRIATLEASSTFAGKTWIVSASTCSSSMWWWVFEDAHHQCLGKELSFEGSIDAASHADGCVVGLTSAFNLVMSSHASGSILLWHGPSHSCIMHLPGDNAQCVAAALCGSVVALVFMPRPGLAKHPVTAQSNPRYRDGKICGSLQCADFKSQERPVQQERCKEAKRTKPPKMFAHKSRGGRQNQKSKQAAKSFA